MRMFRYKGNRRFMVVMLANGDKFEFPHTHDGWDQRVKVDGPLDDVIEVDVSLWLAYRQVWRLPVDLDTRSDTSKRYL